MTMFPEPTMRPHPPHSSPPRSRRATSLLRPLAALSLAVLLGACASKEPAPQPQQRILLTSMTFAPWQTEHASPYNSPSLSFFILRPSPSQAEQTTVFFPTI